MAGPMTDLEVLASGAAKTLKAEDHPGYLSQPIPSSLDQQILSLIDKFLQATPSQQAMMKAKFNDSHSFTFIVFSERMAALAVRERSRDLLFNGLVALAFEDAKFDVRENILVMAPLYHSAVKIGVDPKPLFKVAAVYAIDEELNASILKFPNRAEADRSLEAMDYTESMAPDGFRYKRTW